MTRKEILTEARLILNEPCIHAPRSAYTPRKAQCDECLAAFAVQMMQRAWREGEDHGVQKATDPGGCVESRFACPYETLT